MFRYAKSSPKKKIPITFLTWCSGFSCSCTAIFMLKPATEAGHVSKGGDKCTSKSDTLKETVKLLVCLRVSCLDKEVTGIFIAFNSLF